MGKIVYIGHETGIVWWVMKWDACMKGGNIRSAFGT